MREEEPEELKAIMGRKIHAITEWKELNAILWMRIYTDDDGDFFSHRIVADIGEGYYEYLFISDDKWDDLPEFVREYHLDKIKTTLEKAKVK